LAASLTGISGPTHSAPLCMASLTFMARLQSLDPDVLGWHQYSLPLASLH